MAGRRAVFLDRDDTLMKDVVYCRNPDDVQILPGAAEGVRLLSEAGFLIVITTNQSGLARGLITQEELAAVNARLRAELRSRGADFDALYYCPHLPDAGCDCRKPNPGLILRAASELGLDLANSYSIGDREWDIEAGRSAGTHTVLVTNAERTAAPTTRADVVCRNLVDAAEVIQAEVRAHRPSRK